VTDNLQNGDRTSATANMCIVEREGYNGKREWGVWGRDVENDREKERNIGKEKERNKLKGKEECETERDKNNKKNK
jgi:hypothetical protein